MLFWSEGIDFTAPVCEFAGSYFLVDFERNIVDHLAWLATYLVTVLYKIFGAECLDCK